ncbi:hypothetical protein [Candidatus Nitrosocosmicus hydrocola]|uniref:hypothetical protein n=1 Tax=Candidatus Nitrosocosmicus hydrocola TaxID=1826872 RepID=UPI0011E5FA23|nr:hypothetical protein [Candidatus Nitrosocosmicus hydrocola]
MSSNIDWTDVIKKEARGLNDYDLGEVQEVTNGLILTQKGIVNKEIFSIPQNVVVSYDGKVLRFRISEEEATGKYKKYFERDPNEISADSTELENKSPKFDTPKIDTVIDNAVDDTLEEALTPPTAEEMGIEKKVRRERAILVDETNSKIATTNENPSSYEANTAEDTQSDLDEDKQAGESTNSKEDESNPLKKEEAGIS